MPILFLALATGAGELALGNAIGGSIAWNPGGQIVCARS